MIPDRSAERWNENQETSELPNIETIMKKVKREVA